MSIELTMQQSLSKANRSTSIPKVELEHFIHCTNTLLSEMESAKDEPAVVPLVNKFLSNVFYGNSNAINTKSPIDLVIYADVSAKDSRPIVLFEIKHPNNTDEMVRRDDLNRKAMHELVLYYIREELKEHNTDIKSLVITDGIQWFIFDKRLFYECFAAKKSFAAKVIKADAEKCGTKYIYEQIISPHIAEIDDQLRYTYLNLADVSKVGIEQIARSRKVASAYKLLSPIHLLKQAVIYDHNELSSAFYHELLYIMGLEEVMIDNIARIKRCKPKNRQRHSLLEETILLFEEQNTNMAADDVEEAALGLVITWVNRLLFLKLLEAQLLSFNAGKCKKFLTPDRISSYYALNDLFFQVLAHPVDERITEMNDRFEDIPYLNSSLFEQSPLEVQFFRVRELRGGKMKVFRSTRIHDDSHRRYNGELSTLKYLLLFLDAYDFSGNPLPDEANEEEAKTIINASVLGIIFEKINGYKEGAFFTPSSLSEYMCREVIRRAVVDKFNEAYAEKGTHFSDFQMLVDTLPVDMEAREDANRIINSLRICDPSVGSGHFLVSALNELLLVKHELGCLSYVESRKRVKEYSLQIKDDELVVREKGEGIFKYQRRGGGYDLQKTLYEEKRTIIENCLFGVDVNIKSAEICRLRLWIELLKNAYYENGKLQTLPNIDINIKCGNSLLSKYPVNVGEGILNPDKPELLHEYITLVQGYKACNDKRRKALMGQRLNELTKGEMVLDAVYRSLFDTQVSPRVMAYTLDWMLVFPEVLDEKGRFMGFDIIIGNPPYINMQSMPEMSDVYANLEIRSRASEGSVVIKGNKDKVPLYKTYSSTGDICTLFFERGLQILKPHGYLCFITTNKWMRSDFGKQTRQFLTSQANPILLVDFPGQKLFAKATVETCILLLSRENNQHQLHACATVKHDKGLYDIVHGHLIPCDFNGDEDWVIRTVEDFSILAKIQEHGRPLYTWHQSIYRGILTGKNSVFIVADAKRQEILAHCQDESEYRRTEQLFKPILKGRDLMRYEINYGNRWLIHTHNGIRNPEEENCYLIDPINIEEYPSIKSYLDENWEAIKDRTDKGYTPYNLRNCVYWPEFDKLKIIWGDLADVPKFCLDEDEHYYGDNTTYWMTGNHLTYLLVYLNSPLSAYLFSKLGNTTGAGTIRWQKFKIEQQLIPTVSTEDEQNIIQHYEAYKATSDESHLQEAYHIIYNIVGLNDEEINYIEKETNQ
ncbi:MAG: Eco57I restriction-modification methylase domain-containing protein [Bacteroidaceae bacterium]|nr:Eco57I restriction-modification methylase domain-containing protein [Bacteroidaceae bacterium]